MIRWNSTMWWWRGDKGDSNYYALFLFLASTAIVDVIFMVVYSRVSTSWFFIIRCYFWVKRNINATKTAKRAYMFPFKILNSLNQHRTANTFTSVLQTYLQHHRKYTAPFKQTCRHFNRSSKLHICNPCTSIVVHKSVFHCTITSSSNINSFLNWKSKVERNYFHLGC